MEKKLDELADFDISTTEEEIHYIPGEDLIEHLLSQACPCRPAHINRYTSAMDEKRVFVHKIAVIH
jgi:hypothetical protein